MKTSIGIWDGKFPIVSGSGNIVKEMYKRNDKQSKAITDLNEINRN